MENNYVLTKAYFIEGSKIKFVINKHKTVVGAWKDTEYVPIEKFDGLVNEALVCYKNDTKDN